MFMVMMPSPLGRQAVILELARRHVPRQDVPAAIGLHARRRNAGLLHVVDDAVEADVRGEPELARGLHEAHVALALRDGVHALFAGRLGQVAEQFHLPGGRIEDVHARAHVGQFGAEHVVDPAVAAGAHAVVGVVRRRKAGFVDARDEPPGARAGLRLAGAL